MSGIPKPTGQSVYEQLTEGVRLPLPPVPGFVLDIIAEAIDTAWHNIPPGQAQTADEAGLNAMMETQLNQLTDREQTLRMVVTHVARGKETINFDGTALEMRPDLSIILTAGIRARDFPLATECKLIDAKSGKGVALYCQNGVRRFVDGDYAWARREGLMLAYVRDAGSIQTQLCPYLIRHTEKVPDPFGTEVPPVPVASGSDQAVSRHRRRFAYPDRPLDQPGPISIRHVWLEASAPDRGPRSRRVNRSPAAG